MRKDDPLSPEQERSEESTGVRLKCSEIQLLLFDYLARELGPHRSDFIREHLRRCEVCRNAAAELQATVKALQHLTEPDSPRHLSEERRARIIWAAMHPFLDWIYRHHVACALVVTALVLLGLVLFLRHVRVLGSEPLESTPVVTIGTNQPGSEAEGREPRFDNGNGTENDAIRMEEMRK
ncbi:MAG: anti-sigma factor family protein [Kiritimatiellia bacterium]